MGKQNDCLVALKGHEVWRMRILELTIHYIFNDMFLCSGLATLVRGENGIYLGYSVLAVLHIEVVGIDKGLVEVAHMENSLYFKKCPWQGL